MPAKNNNQRLQAFQFLSENIPKEVANKFVNLFPMCLSPEKIRNFYKRINIKGRDQDIINLKKKKIL
jgi:hypothetical protein